MGVLVSSGNGGLLQINGIIQMVINQWEISLGPSSDRDVVTLLIRTIRLSVLQIGSATTLTTTAHIPLLSHSNPHIPQDPPTLSPLLSNPPLPLLPSQNP